MSDYPFRVVTLNRRGRVLSSLDFVRRDDATSGQNHADEFAANLAYMGGLAFYRVEVRNAVTGEILSAYEV